MSRLILLVVLLVVLGSAAPVSAQQGEQPCYYWPIIGPAATTWRYAVDMGTVLATFPGIGVYEWDYTALPGDQVAISLHVFQCNNQVFHASTRAILQRLHDTFPQRWGAVVAP